MRNIRWIPLLSVVFVSAIAAQSAPPLVVDVKIEPLTEIDANNPAAKVRFTVTSPPANARSMIVTTPDGRPIAASVDATNAANATRAEGYVYGGGKQAVRVEVNDGSGNIIGQSSGCLQFSVKSQIKSADNGITVGFAKQFDDRSLAAMLRDVEVALTAQQTAAIKSVSDAVGRFQGQTADRSFFGVSAQTLPVPATENTTSVKTNDVGATGSTQVVNAPAGTTTTTNAGNAAQNVETTVSDKVTQAAASPQTVTPPPPSAVTFTQTTLGIGAEDLVMEQTNLAAQYVNLRLLLQRALSDRVVLNGNGTSQLRAQPVYGFQISLDPPSQYRDAVAEAVVTISPPPDDVSGRNAPRLVSLLPKEKTYNVASITTRSKAFSIGAIVQVVNAGAAFNRSREALYVVKDTDTVALERMPENESPRKATTFAWQFSPVLGKRIVAPGTRQVFAVLALPTTINEPWDGVVTVRTRWRHFNRKTKSAGDVIQDSDTVQEPYLISVPRLVEQEHAVANAIESLDWREAGASAAIVTLDGHFPEGTRISAADSIIDRPANGMLLQTSRRLSFVVSAERLFFGPALVDGFGVPTALIKPGGEKAPKFEVVAAGPLPENKFAIYLKRAGRRDLLWELLSPAAISDNIRASRSASSLDLHKPLALIGHTVFGLSDAPSRIDNGVVCGQPTLELCKKVALATGITTVTFDVPASALQEARVVKVIDPFYGNGMFAEGVITFATPKKTVVIGELELIGFKGSDAQIALSGKALKDAVNLHLRAGATDCKALKTEETLALFECETAALDDAVRALVTYDGAEPKVLAVPKLPSNRVKVLRHETVREGEARPVRLEGNDLSSVSGARYNGVALNVSHDPNDAGAIFLEVTPVVTSSPGEKLVQLILGDGSVVRTTLVVNEKKKEKSAET